MLCSNTRMRCRTFWKQGRWRERGDEETDASANVNLAAIYIAIGEADAAAESLESAAAMMPAGNPNRARLLAQRARLEYQAGWGCSGDGVDVGCAFGGTECGRPGG